MRRTDRSELTPLGFLDRSAFLFPEKVAIRHNDRRFTYAEFRDRSYRLASALRRAGIRNRDRVAFIAPNIPALLEAHFGVPAAGASLVAINTRLSRKEIDAIILDSGARVVFVDSELDDTLGGLQFPGATTIRIDDSGASDDPYERFLDAGVPNRPLDWPRREEEVISINYTSGTTGQPKGVMYTHRSAYLNALGEVIETGLSLGTVYLWTLPMFHCNGWCFTWAVTAVAGEHVCLRKFDPGYVWDAIDNAQVTHLNGSPTVHISIVNHPKAHPLVNPVVATVAGAPPSPTLLHDLEALNFRPIHVYGLTETYGPITVCERRPEWTDLKGDELAALVARQGQAYITADLVRVVDSRMVDVPRDGVTMGEVVMRGNNVMAGYFQQSDATAHAFAGGWFHSGDVAVWHDDGNIEIRDRIKDVIISGGENISTVEVEKVICRHPAVLECAVVGVPDDKWGERPKAFVAPKPGVAIDADTLREFCREEIARYKCPDEFEFGPLPKTSTGKVQKYLLRQRAGANAERHADS